MEGLKRVAIVGGGKGGSDLIETLSESENTKVVAIADCNPLAPALSKAELMGVPIFLDFKEMLDETICDLIIDVTGSHDVRHGLNQIKDADVEIIGGAGARLMCELLEEKRRSREDTRRRLAQFEDLYRFGLVLSSNNDLREVNGAIIEFATKLTNCPAGSLVILDQKSGEMFMGASKGFGHEVSTVRRWKLRTNGLTSYILNQKMPVVIPDLSKFKSFDNQTLIKEGIKSLIAAPLTVEGRIIGILYVDDYVVRQFSSDDIYALTLISTYAALSIERTKLMEDTRMLAITDGLTGLYNHRSLFARFEEELERCKRYGHPLTLVTFDIDYFKNYNDTFGHMQGNDALRQISEIVKDNTRQIDFSARCGGEEFTILIPETDKAKGLAFAERLRKEVEQSRFYGEEKQPGGKFTISVGVAAMPDDTVDGFDLMNKADQALYEAKHLGRNRVIAYEESLVSLGSTCEWRPLETAKEVG